MLLPVLLLLLATLSAALGAYGIHPNWAQYPHGVDVILMARRLQWPLFGFSILLCIAVFAMVISGKRRIFWLIGLAPVLALFFHRFHSDPLRTFSILDNPPFAAADQVSSILADDDWVVGLRFNDETYAFPYASLYLYPAIVYADHDQRMILLWSAFANHAAAAKIDRELKAQQLEIVSFPANALLLYNSRLGEFLNGITLAVPGKPAPHGIGAAIPTTKTTWKIWRSLNPSTKVLAIVPGITGLPKAPVLPYYPIPTVSNELQTDARIAVLWSEPPLAILSDAIPARPLNLNAGSQPLLLVRDKTTSLLRAFSRQIDTDLSPQFKAAADPAHPNVAYIDVDTQTGWSVSGTAVEGDPKFKGKKLTSVRAEDDLYWPIMKFWLPELKLHPRQPGDPEPEMYTAPTSTHVAPVRRRR